MEFKTLYEKELFNIYTSTVENYWTERGYYERLNTNPLSSESISGGLVSLFKEKIGGFNAKIGLFYEKRMGLINDCVSLHKDELGISPIGNIVKGSENRLLEGRIPTDTLSLIQKIANKMYESKNVSKWEFQGYLQEIFDSFMISSAKKNLKTHFIRHKIDCLMQTDLGITYLVESKTKAQEQDDNAKGCIKRILEGWILLISDDIQNNKPVDMDTYRIIIPMNELMDDSLDIAFYYPTFDIKHPEFGGVISVETFYKYFFDISYHDIITVEEKYGRNTDELFIETFFYCVNHYMKNGNIDKNVVQSLSTKYIDLC